MKSQSAFSETPEVKFFQHSVCHSFLQTLHLHSGDSFHHLEFIFFKKQRKHQRNRNDKRCLDKADKTSYEFDGRSASPLALYTAKGTCGKEEHVLGF